MRVRILNGKQTLLLHGGAGNRAIVSSDYLTLQQAQNLIAATQRALCIGKLLTRHWTVRLCDDICTDSVMVISASMPGFTHAVTGTFGKDEPWPDWCDPNGLQRDFASDPATDELAFES